MAAGRSGKRETTERQLAIRLWQVSQMLPGRVHTTMCTGRGFVSA
jgi:hypothetical protein